MLSRVIRFGLAPAAFLLMSVAASAQVKVAIIDMREAVNGTAEVKKAVAALETRLKPKQAEAEKLNKDLVDIKNKLDSLAGKLTPQGEADLQTQGQRKQRELQRLQEDVNAELEREQNDVGSRALTRMRDVVKKLAEEKGFDVVMDVNNTIYSKPALTITKDAIAAYDKAFAPK